jgi:periplasmic protein TonB
VNDDATDLAASWQHDDPHRWWTTLRWGLCSAAVLGLHAAGTWIALHGHRAEEPVPAPPPAAIMIELAPQPAAPPAPSETPPGPKQAVSQPPPPEDVAPPPLPLVPPAPAPHAEVSLPPKPPPKLPRPHRRVVVQRPPRLLPDNEPPAPATTAPPRTAAPSAPAIAAPARELAAARSSDALPSWQGLLLARLEQFKRYPSAALLHHQQGVADLRFTIDRQGRVLSDRIEKSSGVPALDAETLALVHRAEPLPPPPPDVQGNAIELVVPVQFLLK